MTKILAIDDTPYNLDILKNGLEDEGFEMLTALNGRKGLELIDAERPDLVLLDIGMPEMDGHSVLRAIRALERERGLSADGAAKIIMTTALDDSQNVLGAFKEGCEGYVVKPIRRDDLLHQLEKLGFVS